MEQDVEDEREMSESFFDSTDTLPPPAISFSHQSASNNNSVVVNDSSNDSMILNYENSNDGLDAREAMATSNSHISLTHATNNIVNVNTNFGTNDNIEEEIIVDQ